MAGLDIAGDALPLLAYKIAPRQFDLSYRFSNISLRDQIVRAQTLVRTLVNTKLLAADPVEDSDQFQLLICGAGAAGLAAAREAEAHNLSFVLIERDRAVPGGVLKEDAERYVSAAMYEWPHPNHSAHEFPLAAPALLGADDVPLPSLKLALQKPVLVRTFGRKLREALRPNIRRWKEQGKQLRIGQTLFERRVLMTRTTLAESSKASLRRMVSGRISIHGIPLTKIELPPMQLASTGGKKVGQPLLFQYIIFAVGFAKESREYAEGKEPDAAFEHTHFWRPDRLSDHQLDFKGTPPRVVILGSGDGALQDALRCLVYKQYPHPLAIWNHLLNYKHAPDLPLAYSPHIATALARIAAADGYTTSGAVWTSEKHVFGSLDIAIGHIIDDLIAATSGKLARAVESMLRKDVERVTIVTQAGYFSKAYALNRFLVLLFHRVMSSMDNHLVKLDIIADEVTDFQTKGSDPRSACLTLDHGKKILDGDVVLIRGGLDRSSPPSQQVGLSGIDTGRAGLGRIPAPIRPVAIAKSDHVAALPALLAVPTRRRMSPRWRREEK